MIAITFRDFPARARADRTAFLVFTVLVAQGGQSKRLF